MRSEGVQQNSIRMFAIKSVLESVSKRKSSEDNVSCNIKTSITVPVKETVYEAGLAWTLKNLDSFHGLTKALFDDMQLYGFDEYPSVMEKTKDEFAPVCKDRHTILKQYTLFDHTMRVARLAADEAMLGGDPVIVRDMSIILALAHDAGKAPGIINRYAVNKNDPHHITSSVYLNRRLKDMLAAGKDDSISSEHLGMFVDLKYHHFIAKNPRETPPPLSRQMMIMKMADMNAREEEIRLAEVKYDG